MLDPLLPDDPDDSEKLTVEELIKDGNTHFLTASIIFGKLQGSDGEPQKHEYAECYKGINEETIRDFYKRVMDDVCNLIDEDDE
tara:strand:+ start:380 stop:631 length:252 start_codon:yes stop_codon:yes gene_type:complete